MELWTEVRRRVLTGEIGKREACRQDQLHWQTLEKILGHVEPPGYRRAKSWRSLGSRTISTKSVKVGGEFVPYRPTVTAKIPMRDRLSSRNSPKANSGIALGAITEVTESRLSVSQQTWTARALLSGFWNDLAIA
jgi:hypothetical protein